MADANQQAQELAEIMERVNREMVMFGKMQQSTSNDLQDATMKAKYGINNFTKGTEQAADAFTSVAKAGVAAAGAMYEGKKGAAAFNSSIDELSNAAKLAGAALTLLVPGGPIMKLFIAGITAAATATAEYVKKANEMADKIYSGYSKLAKTGAAAGDGMTGVYKGAKKLGLSMNELDGYVSLVGTSSKDLALFGGTVFEGRKKFEDIGEAMEPYRQQLIAAGMTQEQINEGTMGYIRLQTQLGNAQKMTNRELADGAKKYLYEMDGLSKLTGESRQEMEKNMEAARNEQRFRAKLEEVRVTQGEEAAKRLEKANILISSQSKEMGQAFRDISTGMIGTEAAQKGLRGTYGELQQTTDKLIAGQINEYEAVKNVGDAAGQVAKDMNFSAQMGTFNDYATDYAGQLKLGIFAQQDQVAMAKVVEEAQKKQAAGADGITDQYAKNIKQQQELNKKMEDAVFKGIENALSVTNKLGNVTEHLTTVFDKLATVANKLLNVFGLGVKEPEKPKPQTAQEAAATKVTTAARDVAKPMQEKVDNLAKQLEADEKALKDAKRAGKYGDELKPLEDKILKNKQEYEKASKELLEQENKIRQAALEERKIRQQQKLDQSELARIENMNVAEVERLAKLNEQKANLVKQGLDTTKKDKEIADAKLKIDQQKLQMAELQKKLAPAAPTTATGTAPATAPAGGGRGNVNPPLAGSEPIVASQADLKSRGLKIKEGDVQAKDSKINPKVIEMAEQVQANMPNFAYFSGFNDKFHQEKSPSSEHTKGNAMDFALTKEPSKEEGQEIVKYLKSLGATVAIDEYNNPSAKATAGHIHASVPGYADGGVAETPQIAFVAEKGPEVMLPLNSDGTLPISLKTGEAKEAKPMLVDFPEDIKKFFQLQGQVDNLKFLKGSQEKQTFPDVAPDVATGQAKMFATLDSMKKGFMDQGFDKSWLENYGEEPAKQKTEENVVDLQSMNKDNDDSVVSAVKENAAATNQLVSLIGELIRAQKDQNDISSRLLQVAAN